MKFTKALIAPAALLLTVAGLASCGGEKEPDVVFWSNVYGDREEAWANKLVEDFNKEYPNISVKIERAGRYGDINEKVQGVLNTPKKLPNLVVGYPDFFYNYIDKLVNLDTFINNEKIGFGKKTVDDKTTDEINTKKDDVVKAYIEEGQQYQKKGTYSLPFGKTTEALFVNDAILAELGYEEAPTTFAEMAEISGKMLAKYPERYVFKKDGKEVKGAYAPISFHSTSNFVITAFKMLDIPYASNVDANKDGKLTKEEAVLFNNDKAKEFIAGLKVGFELKAFTTKDISAAVGGQAYVENDFVKKDPSSIMIYDSTKGTSYVANSINKINDEGKPGQSDGANMVSSAHPIVSIQIDSTKPEPKKVAMNQGGSIAMFDHGEEANEKAWLFYKFMTNTENCASYSVANSTAPARKSSYEVKEIKDIVNGSTTAVTPDSNWADQFKKLNGEVFNIYKDYSVNDTLYTAPVNKWSSAERSAIEQMFINIMTTPVDMENEEAVKALIDSEFTKAYEAI